MAKTVRLRYRRCRNRSVSEAYRRVEHVAPGDSFAIPVPHKDAELFAGQVGRNDMPEEMLFRDHEIHNSPAVTYQE